jgi:GT2 family glycosyltransferase
MLEHLNMSSNDFSVSIVIVTYEETELLNSTLISIFKSISAIKSQASYEIVIVDNSRSESVQKYLFNSEFFDKIKFIHNAKNGFGLANNIGTINSSGDFLMFINPDVVISEDFFSNLEKRLNITSSFFYAPVQYSKNGKRGLSFYFIDEFSFFSEILIKFLNSILYFDNNKMYLSGAFLILRREDFLRVGMFDENLFMYYEEPDLSKRLFKIGVKAKLIRDLNYFHYGGGSSSKLGIDMERIRIQTFKLYSLKWGINYIKALKKMLFSSLIKYILLSKTKFIDSSKADFHKKVIDQLREHLK